MGDGTQKPEIRPNSSSAERKSPAVSGPHVRGDMQPKIQDAGTVGIRADRPTAAGLPKSSAEEMVLNQFTNIRQTGTKSASHRSVQDLPLVNTATDATVAYPGRKNAPSISSPPASTNFLNAGAPKTALVDTSIGANPDSIQQSPMRKNGPPQTQERPAPTGGLGDERISNGSPEVNLKVEIAKTKVQQVERPSVAYSPDASGPAKGRKQVALQPEVGSGITHRRADANAVSNDAPPLPTHENCGAKARPTQTPGGPLDSGHDLAALRIGDTASLPSNTVEKPSLADSSTFKLEQAPAAAPSGTTVKIPHLRTTEGSALRWVSDRAHAGERVPKHTASNTGGKLEQYHVPPPDRAALSAISQPFAQLIMKQTLIHDPTKHTSEISTIETRGSDQMDPFRSELSIQQSALPPSSTRSDLSSLARQLADALPAAAARPIDIALNPEELGRVRMALSTSEGGVTVHIVAERPETLDLLRRHITELAQEFHSIGYGDVKFSFSGGDSHEREGEQSTANAGSDPMTLVEGDLPAHNSLPPAPQSGVDIRL